MIIKRITVKNFGSVEFYDVTLNSELNIVDTLFSEELSCVIELILCSKVLSDTAALAAKNQTLITAELCLDSQEYFIELKPTDKHTLALSVADANGNDMTDYYRYTMSHCREQDDAEIFDGRDKSFPFRFCWYRGCDDRHLPKNLAGSTNNIVATKTFRSHLIRYIRAFRAEPIGNKKNYHAAINKEGRFEVICPGVFEKASLSETEERLFLYICFLNVAEFWEGIEKIRDMHHQKKPLVIKNFLEFLDEPTDTSRLAARTVKLGRQVIILTLPMDEQAKRKWLCA